jgi:hypothetical protein
MLKLQRWIAAKLPRDIVIAEALADLTLWDDHHFLAVFEWEEATWREFRRQPGSVPLSQLKGHRGGTKRAKRLPPETGAPANGVAPEQISRGEAIPTHIAPVQTEAPDDGQRES